MDLPSITLEHGERYGKLTVLYKCSSDKRGPKYRVGCACGHRLKVSAKKLMRGEVKECRRCAASKCLR